MIEKLVVLAGSLFGSTRTSSRRVRASRPRSTIRPRLEYLEDRVVPDAMEWAPPNPGTDIKWSTAGNWWDDTTVNRATAAPGASDTVKFGGVNGTNNDCTVTGASASCAQITALSGYTSRLNIDGQTLTVASSTLSSDWEGGSGAGNNEIRSGTTAGTLDVQANFTYNTQRLNYSGGNPTLAVYVDSSDNTYTPILTMGSNCGFSVANFNVGYDTGSNAKDGELKASTSGISGCDYGGKTMSVSVDGTFLVDTNATAYNWGNITNSGIVGLYSASNLRLITGSSISDSGTLETVGHGNSNVTGGITVNSGGEILLDKDSTGYSTMTVTGNVEFKDGSEYVYNVNGASLSQCNQLTATNVTLDSTSTGVTSDCITNGTNSAGNHSYAVLKATNSLTGTFSTLVWGGNGTAWSRTYTATQLNLTGTI